jgi:hypothetical protein
MLDNENVEYRLAAEMLVTERIEAEIKTQVLL